MPTDIVDFSSLSTFKHLIKFVDFGDFILCTLLYVSFLLFLKGGC